MKYLFSAIVIVTCLFAGCTNQPVSLNKTLPTKDLLGYWQSVSGADVYYISQGPTGRVGAEQLRFDKEAGKWKYDGNSGTCYFKDIKKNGKTYSFISIGDNEIYRTFLYSFNGKKKLSLQEVSYDFIADMHNADEDEVQEFDAPGFFADFINAHLGNKKLFYSAENYQKKKTMADLAKPGK